MSRRRAYRFAGTALAFLTMAGGMLAMLIARMLEAVAGALIQASPFMGIAP